MQHRACVPKTLLIGFYFGLQRKTNSRQCTGHAIYPCSWGRINFRSMWPRPMTLIPWQDQSDHQWESSCCTQFLCVWCSSFKSEIAGTRAHHCSKFLRPGSLPSAPPVLHRSHLYRVGWGAEEG